MVMSLIPGSGFLKIAVSLLLEKNSVSPPNFKAKMHLDILDICSQKVFPLLKPYCFLSHWIEKLDKRLFFTVSDYFC